MMDGYVGLMLVFFGLVIWICPVLKDIFTQLKRIADALENKNKKHDDVAT